MLCGGLFGVFFGEGLVHAHEHSDTGGFAFVFGGFGVDAIRHSNGLVVTDMGGVQFREQNHGIAIQIRKARIGIFGTCVQYHLRRLFDECFLLRCRRRPWEVVVTNGIGIAVTRSKSTANCSHPSHMDVRGKYPKMIQR